MYPLFSMCLITYNQEAVIANAIKNALSQTYPNVEIIISDDHSTDCTYQIIQDIVSSYKGPHQIILNRNKENIGISGNRNIAWNMAKGQWIISQDCDDESLPQRIEIVYKAIQSHPNISYIGTAEYEIDETGHVFANNPFNFSKVLQLSGCNACYRRDLWDIFGPISNSGLDDVMLQFRSLLLGDLLLIDTPTVKKRENSDFSTYLMKEINYMKWCEQSYIQMFDDLEKYKNHLLVEQYTYLKKQLNRKIDYYKSSDFNILLEKKEQIIEVYTNHHLFPKIQKIRNITSSPIKRTKLFLNSFKNFRKLKHQLWKLKKEKRFTNSMEIITLKDICVENKLWATIHL
ncbi:MAG: glycosyltransferase [Bacteroidaceae bacterium]|nr:glycosyltransferase [Bacteroidaceae bacterium]